MKVYKQMKKCNDGFESGAMVIRLVIHRSSLGHVVILIPTLYPVALKTWMTGVFCSSKRADKLTASPLINLK
jgi:hypothetical protein